MKNHRGRSEGKLKDVTDDDKIADAPKKYSGFLIVAPLMVLFSFAHAMAGNVLTDLIIYRTCVVSMGINAAECYGLRANASSPDTMILEAEVEPHASSIVLAKSLTESILPVFASLFVGSWSDRVGRKPLIFTTLFGYTSSYLAYCVTSYWNISPWYLLIGSIPSEITGGINAFILATNSYISDVTQEDYRSLNFAMLSATFTCTHIVGELISLLIYQEYGYTSVFSVSMICSLLGILYVYNRIDESVKINPKTSEIGFLKLTSVKELIASSTVKRKGFNRPVVWLAFITIMITSTIQKHQFGIDFLFTRVRLGWSVQEYSYFSVANAILQNVGLCVILLRTHVSGVSDTFLAGVGLASYMGSAITRSLVWKSWHMYFEMCIRMFSGLVDPVMRSLVSKFVPSEDIGKLFATISLLQTISFFCGVPLLTFIYFNYLPPIYPAPLFLVTTSLYALSAIIVAYMEIMIRKSDRTATYHAAPQEDVLSKYG